MNKAEIIRTYFSYLSDFQYSFVFNKFGYECVFTNGNNVKIYLSESEDYRDENRIDFKIIKGTKTLFSFYYEPMINSVLEGVDEMVSSVNMVYQLAKNTRNGFTKAHFKKIIQVYAKFIELNLNQISQ